MRRIEMALLGTLATGAAIGIVSLAGDRAALAQQPAQCVPTEFDGAEGGILHGAAGEQALHVAACAPGDIGMAQGPIPTIVLGSLDPVNNPQSRFRFTKVFDVRPCSLAGGSDLPGAKVTVSFTSDRQEANARIVITLAPDTEKPTLNTTSTPRKGTKVKPGDTIKVRLEASEEYAYPRRFDWQTGVKKLQLIDESPNPVVTPHWEGTQMRACAAKQWKQFLEVTYTVPPNPPPVIRLRAVAEDFAGNHDEDVAEFPTGDWYGTFAWTHVCEGGGNRDETQGTSDLALNHDGAGKLTGTLTGSTPVRKQTIPSCSFTFVAPGTFSANLAGSYTPAPETFSAQAVDVRTTPGRATWTCPAGGDVIDQAFFAVYETPMFQNAFGGLRRQPDGSLKLIPEGKVTVSAGGGTCTTDYSLTLHRAQN